MASKSKTDGAVKATADRRKVGKKAPSTGLTAYLVVYNALSCLAWSTILVLLLWHIFDGQASTPFKTSTTGVAPTAASLAAKVRQVLVQLQLLLARVLPSAIVHEPAVRSPTSSLLAGIQARLRAAGYTSVGPLVKVVQTAAVLEVVHAALGWVRSPVGTTAAQVASRLWSVWAVAEQFPSARSSSAYSLMVLAWSITEVVRYAFYALNLLNLVPQPLTYLRYSTFLALYPLGAGAEAWSSFVTLPSLSTLPGPLGQAVADVERALGRSPAVVARVAKEVFGRALGERSWSTFDLARATLVFIVWPPALYVMYSYMASQRRKALGPAVRVGTQKKRI